MWNISRLYGPPNSCWSMWVGLHQTHLRVFPACSWGSVTAITPWKRGKVALIIHLRKENVLYSGDLYFMKYLCCFHCPPQEVFVPQIQKYFFWYCFPELLCTHIPEHQITKAVDPLVLETPQKFFLRIKKKLQQQKGSWYRSENTSKLPSGFPFLLIISCALWQSITLSL